MGYVPRHKDVTLTYLPTLTPSNFPSTPIFTPRSFVPDFPLRYRILRLSVAPLQVKRRSRRGEPLRSLDSQNPHAYAYFSPILWVHVNDPLCIDLYPDAYPDCRVVSATFTGASGGSHGQMKRAHIQQPAAWAATCAPVLVQSLCAEPRQGSSRPAEGRPLRRTSTARL